MAKSIGTEWYQLGLPLTLLVVSAILIHRGALGGQLLARGVWWSNLVLGTMLSTVAGTREDRLLGMMLAFATGGALLLTGQRALASAGTQSGYLPAGLRNVLMLLMVLALADAQTFLLFGSIGLIEGFKSGTFHDLGLILCFVAIGLGYVVGFIGLYRLRVWGVFLNTLVSMAVLMMVCATHEMKPSEGFGLFLTCLAALHILIAVPVVLATLTEAKLPSLPPRVRGLIAVSVVAVMMLVSLVSTISGPIWRT